MKRLFISLMAMLAIVAAQATSPRYIFYFIGDGMGNGHVMAANYYNMTVRQPGQPLLMTTFPIMSVATTYSANRPVTDSAAAGTALATGQKTFNGMLGMTPDSVAVKSVADVLADNGFGIGIVTTVSADDATPGAFYAHQPSRKNYLEIGIEAAESKVAFLAGAGLKGFKDKQGNPTELMKRFEENNVVVARGPEGIKNVESDRIVLLSNDTIVTWNVGYTIDSLPGALNLSMMTQQCLDHMERVSPDKFFMMVEGGNIDHAGHANDGGAVIKEIVNFNEALRIAYDFYLAHPTETLIVVTADHDTGGMAMGNNTLHYNTNLGLVDSQRISKDRFADEIRSMLKQRRVITWDDMQQYLRENLGFWETVPVNERDTEILHQSFVDTFEKRDGKEQEALYNNYSQFATAVFGILNNLMGIGWTTINHTGNPVHVYAIGAGAYLFNAPLDNTQIPARMLQAAGYSF